MGNFAMDVAVKKAKKTGVGWVSVKGSNHFGIAGYYSRQALNEGMLGMAFTNGSPYMAPTRLMVNGDCARHLVKLWFLCQELHINNINSSPVTGSSGRIR